MPLLYFVLSIVFDCAKMVGYRQPPCTVQCSIVQVHNNIRVRVLEKGVGASGQSMGCFFTELVLLLYTVRSELVLILFRACVANEQSLLLLLDKACVLFYKACCCSWTKLVLLFYKACCCSWTKLVVRQDKILWWVWQILCCSCTVYTVHSTDVLLLLEKHVLQSLCCSSELQP